MNKIRLYQILSVLLLPYREPTFLKHDPIAKVRYTFAELKYQKQFLHSSKRYNKNYNDAERELGEFLRNRKEWYIHTLDDFRLLLELFFPEEEAVKICAIASGKKQTENPAEDVLLKTCLDPLYLKNLYKIAKSLLTFRDGKIAIRTWTNEKDEEDLFRYPNVFDKVEIWNLLSRMMTVDLLIVAFFIEANLKKVYYLHNQTGGILLADKTLEKILQKGLAETHMHFSAGSDFMYIWQNEMEPDIWEKGLIKDKKESYLKNGTFSLAVYRMLWAEYLEYIKNDEELSFSQMIVLNYPEEADMLLEILTYIRKGILDCYFEEWGVKFSSFIWAWKHRYRYDKKRGDFLLSTIYRPYYQYYTGSEMIFLLQSLLYFQEHDMAGDELHLFFQYIRGKNRYYMQMMQFNQIEGLSNFRYSFSKMLTEFHKKEDRGEKYDDIFRNVVNNIYLKKLEIRISPEISMFVPDAMETGERDGKEEEIQRKLLRQIKHVLVAYRRNRLEAAGIEEWRPSRNELVQKLDIPCRNGKLTVPTIGIVFHYLKNDYVDNRIGNTCWVKKWKDISKDSKHVLVWREILVKNAMALEKLRSQIPLLSEYVVGIDAASEENKTEPWVFAPMYSAIRNRKITKPVLEDSQGEISKINNIGFTYHVGEEYRHLLSGLRHIDEVVNHFHYKAGDRLGHATALGVDIKYWMEKNETVVIPIMEHMENLLWFWGNMVHRNWGIEINAEAVEGKILELAKMVYGAIDGITVPILYEAYTAKFTASYWKRLGKMRQYIGNEEETSSAREKGLEHFCKFYKVEGSPYGLIWTVDKVFCTYFCPLYYQRFNRPILVHVGKEEYGMLKKIQDYVRQEVERVGIYVETNPTSNLTIGEVRSLFEHPILNLNSKGLIKDRETEHEVLVTINSDNPLIFNTSNENELAYIYHALCYQGYKKESILEWIDKVRKMGMDSSFVKNEKKPSVHMKEIEELVDMINAVLKETIDD